VKRPARCCACGKHLKVGERPPIFPLAGRPNVTVTANKAIRNADLGIEAIPGVVDGGGNKAAANENRLQCLNVVCK
jgi:hypothetical protein